MTKKQTINDDKKYAGNFVATDSFNDKTVVASGRDPIEVRQNAINSGHLSPVVFFVPKKNSIHIY